MKSRRTDLSVEFISYKNGMLLLEAEPSEQVDYYVQSSSVSYRFKARSSLRPKLSASIPIEGSAQITFSRKTGSTKEASFCYGKFSGLNEEVRGSYFVVGDVILKAKPGAIKVSKYKVFTHVALELNYLFMLLLARKKALLYRVAYWVVMPLIRHRDIWLLSDRPYTAGDNADYLFRYICRQKDLPQEVLPVFALNKAHDRYQELKKYGRVVPFGGFRYIVIALLARVRISSHFDEYIVNPLGGGSLCSDICRPDFVYLGHGVLTSDSSDYFGRLERNAKLITTASEKERRAILDKKYGYEESVVRVTGQARFDGLLSNSTRTILLMPTWREAIAGSSANSRASQKGFRKYSEDFKNTEYFHFYDSLITSRELLDALEVYDYRLEFYIHPSFAAQWNSFTPSRRVKLMKPPHNYEKALTKGAIMITDYSGVAFDFAYMHKPVIYAQFDRKDLYQNHYYKPGYFSFADDGFGPVVSSQAETIRELVSLMDKDGKMPNVYASRVDSFFENIDQNNCERIYKELLGL